jgi:hypothetical protein
MQIFFSRFSWWWWRWSKQLVKVFNAPPKYMEMMVVLEQQLQLMELQLQELVEVVEWNILLEP